MNALLGRYDRRIGERGLAVLPAEWRRVMGNPSRMYLTADINERCLDLIPRDLFEKAAIRDRLKQEVRLVEVDGRGRIRIDKDFREAADIHDVVAMVGELRLIKLWNPENLARNGVVSAEEDFA